MNRTTSLTARAMGAIASLAFVAGTALAHAGHNESSTDFVTPTLLVVGLGLLGVTLSLERVWDIERRFADVGFFFGLLLVVAALANYWL